MLHGGQPVSTAGPWQRHWAHKGSQHMQLTLSKEDMESIVHLQHLAQDHDRLGCFPGQDPLHGADEVELSAEEGALRWTLLVAWPSYTASRLRT